ncbi:hypothetical protein HBI84_211710 [Parastagonospora nodorum]|nr:hypothetical protein HBI84_211710 [Parastagonospora nodorum]
MRPDNSNINNINNSNRGRDRATGFPGLGSRQEERWFSQLASPTSHRLTSAPRKNSLNLMLLQRRRHRNMRKPANRNGRSCDVQKALHARPLVDWLRASGTAWCEDWSANPDDKALHPLRPSLFQRE